MHDDKWFGNEPACSDHLIVRIFTKVALANSKHLFEESLSVLAGGASRSMVVRQPFPHFASHGKGTQLYAMDGKKWTDFSNNTASLIHGHAHPCITSAVVEQVKRGSAFSLATESELRLAQHICSRNETFERIRFVNSGTEAVMSMIKIARAVTGKAKIAKAEGAYHGCYDLAEVSQHSRPEIWGAVDSPNSTSHSKCTSQNTLDDVVVFPFNDIERTLKLLDENKEQLACVLIDPLPHRLGLIPASEEFVRAVREWTTRHGALLVFDEVISFRMSYGGAQDWYSDIDPDLTALGKIIGGGFPVGALVGRAKFMDVLDPKKISNPVAFSGTFAANPVSMTAGQVAMEQFDHAAIERLNVLGEDARKRIAKVIQSSGVDACVTGAGSMFRIYLKPSAPTEFRTAWQDDKEALATRFLVDFLYERGLLLINTCTGALSTPMDTGEIDALVDAIADGFKALVAKGLV